jgi:2-oxoglutarate dehydrogenase E2 component (dihydrolipoamide succinyltransferase)
MPTNILMPQLGESVTEATLSKWLKHEGDTVKEFEPLMEVATDKVTTEVVSPASGVLAKILIAEGQVVAVGTLLGMIGQAGEKLKVESHGVAAVSAPPSTKPAPITAAPPASQNHQPLGFLSPIVSKLAAEHQVDLSQIKGTGLNNRITKKDVLAFVETRHKPQSPISNLQSPKPQLLANDTVVPLSQMRKSIAEHMVRSKHTSPHVTTVFEVDMSAVSKHRAKNKDLFARDGVNLTFTAYLIAAIVPALKHYPMVNSVFNNDSLIYKRDINIGMAVSLEADGLIVPVIKRADEKSLLALAREVNDLANRARNKQLKPDETQGGTFTLTNHGVSGSLFATPIINQPQCGILGAGAIQKRAVVINDAIAIRPMMYLSFAFDHRILDGATADYFVAKIKETLEAWA